MINAIPENMQGLVKPMIDPIMNELSRYEETSAASVSLDGSSQTRFGFNVGAMYDINEKLNIFCACRLCLGVLEKKLRTGRSGNYEETN